MGVCSNCKPICYTGMLHKLVNFLNFFFYMRQTFKRENHIRNNSERLEISFFLILQFFLRFDKTP